MVGNMWKLCVCALALVATNDLVGAQTQTLQDGDDALMNGVTSAQIRAEREGVQKKVQPEQGDKSQEVVFENGLDQGFGGTYQFTRAIEYAEQMGEDPASREAVTENISFTLRTASKGPGPDGIASVVASFERFRARVETPDGPISVDFDLNADLPEDADTLSGLDAMLPALKNASLQILVDANGNVTSISGLPDVASVLGDDQGGAALFSVLEDQQFAVLFSKLFNAEGGVERTSTEDDAQAKTWSTVEEVGLGPSGSLIVTRSWVPRALPSGELEARGTFAASVDAPAVVDEAAPTFTIGSYQGVSRLLWMNGGGLSYLNATETIALQWTLGAESMRTVQETVTTINRLEE